jgi:hypothetical protein
MAKPCTCDTGSFIGCPAHDAAMRSPEQVAADIEALHAQRERRAADPRFGRFGGIVDVWNAYAEVDA